MNKKLWDIILTQTLKIKLVAKILGFSWPKKVMNQNLKIFRNNVSSQKIVQLKEFPNSDHQVTWNMLHHLQEEQQNNTLKEQQILNWGQFRLVNKLM